MHRWHRQFLRYFKEAMDTSATAQKSVTERTNTHSAPKYTLAFSIDQACSYRIVIIYISWSFSN